MNFIEEMKKRARTDIKTIVLPEAKDKRVLEAASKVEKEAFAKIILIGNIEKTKENEILVCKKYGRRLSITYKNDE